MRQGILHFMEDNFKTMKVCVLPKDRTADTDELFWNILSLETRFVSWVNLELVTNLIKPALHLYNLPPLTKSV